MFSILQLAEINLYMSQVVYECLAHPHEKQTECLIQCTKYTLFSSYKKYNPKGCTHSLHLNTNTLHLYWHKVSLRLDHLS